MIKRPTIVMLLVLALVIGAYFFFKSHPFKSAEPTPTTVASQYLITSADGILISLQVQDNQGDVVHLLRDSSQTWVIAQPLPGAADQGLAGAAESQVGALRIVSLLETPPNPADMGLDAPSYTIKLGFENNLQHTLEVGTMTPTSSGYYVRFDGAQTYVISQSGIDSLLNLLTAPPYLPTETPTETPTSGIETITPTLETITPTP